MGEKHHKLRRVEELNGTAPEAAPDPQDDTPERKQARVALTARLRESMIAFCEERPGVVQMADAASVCAILAGSLAAQGGMTPPNVNQLVEYSFARTVAELEEEPDA